MIGERASSSRDQEPCAPANLFDLIWERMSAILGCAATATLLRRCLRAMPPRSGQAALTIGREGFEYRYVVPELWKEPSQEALPALRDLLRELRPLLMELTGPVVLETAIPTTLGGGLAIRPRVVVADDPESSKHTMTRTLSDIAQTLESANAANERLLTTLRLLQKLIPYDRAALLVAAKPGAQSPSTMTPESREPELFAIPELSPDERQSLSSRLAGFLRVIETKDPVFPTARGHHLALPIVALDRVVGILFVERETGAYNEVELGLLSVIGAQVAAYLTIVRSYQEACDLDRFKEEMAEVIVHDLKNPVAAIIANVDFALSDPQAVSEAVRMSLADVQSASNRILRLIANLLDLSRLESDRLVLQREATRLTALLAPVVQHRTVQARSRNIVLRSIAEPDLEVHVDGDLLIRAVENILDNALRHTPRGGQIEIRTKRMGSGVQIRIGNSGLAIPEAARPRMFEKYGPASSGGRMNLGLGLYFCRLVAEAHGGRIWLEEAPDLQWVFVMELKDGGRDGP